MYSRVLVPLDGSPYSEEILPYAAQISRMTSARLTVFRAVSDRQSMPEAEDYLGTIAPRYNADSAPVDLGDDAADAIVREANKEPRAVVAMTSHARTGLMETLIGSVARRVMHTIDRPIVVFRPKGSAGSSEAPEIRTIVLALDGSALAETIEDATAQMAKWLGARILVVQVLPTKSSVPQGIPPGDIIESGYVSLRAAKIGGSHGVEADWEVIHGNPADALCDHVAGLTDVVLAMSSHGRSGAGEMIFGSVAAECLRRSGVPILIQVPPR